MREHDIQLLYRLIDNTISLDNFRSMLSQFNKMGKKMGEDTNLYLIINMRYNRTEQFYWYS